MDFKTLSLVGGNIMLDHHTSEETIRIYWEATEEGFFYLKQRVLQRENVGADDPDYEDSIRFRSIWYADLKTSTVTEVVPYGNYDISEFRATSASYFYFHKLDYEKGQQICRVHKQTKEVEVCTNTDDDFHGFEIVTDRYVMYQSEDKIPDVSELVIVDMVEQKIAAISMNRNDTDQFEYLFTVDAKGEIEDLILNRWVPEYESSTSRDHLVCCKWNEVERLLIWMPIV